MSYCEMLAFKKGGYDVIKEYKNAHGFLAYIWDALFNAHVVKENEWDCWIGNPEKVWELWESDKIEDYEKSVLGASSDHAMVKIEDITEFIGHMKKFVTRHPPGDNRVCHINAMIDDLSTIAIHPKNYISIGWYGMSCSENLWDKYDENTDDVIQYDVTTGDKHQFVTLEEDEDVV